jgi:predicted nucleic acid-binding protein
MTLLDTDVTVDILRNYPLALAWLQGLGAAPLGLPGLVVMELLQGCQNKGNSSERVFESHWTQSNTGAIDNPTILISRKHPWGQIQCSTTRSGFLANLLRTAI